MHLQELPYQELPHDEEAQPTHPDHDPRGERHRAQGLCEIWCVRSCFIPLEIIWRTQGVKAGLIFGIGVGSRSHESV